jgi:hypothetical protein
LGYNLIEVLNLYNQKGVSMGLTEHTILFFASLIVILGAFFHAGGSLAWYHWLLVAFSILGLGKSITFFIPDKKSDFIK